MSSFGENLKAYRKSLGLGQKEMGNLLGLKQSTIANYENGVRFPKKENLNNLASMLNVSIDSLMDEKITSDPYPITESLYDVAQKQFIQALLNWNENKALEIIKNFSEHTVSVFSLHEKIIKKTLYDIGELWSLGRLSVIQEHYATQVCHKAVSMLSHQVDAKVHSNLTAICMTVNPEEHNLGARIISDALNFIGIKSYFIGTKVPTDQLLQALDIYNITYLVLSVSLNAHLDGMANLIQMIRTDGRFTHLTIIVGGRAFIGNEHLALEYGADIYAKDSIEVIDKLKLTT